MRPSRVLVVDDSVVVRKVLSDVLASDPEVEVAGTAPTAPIALQKISQVNPDLVLLDVEMPEMDGIEAVRRIRASWPTLPVVMCSSLTERGADVTLRALEAGATDYVAKPSSLGTRDAGLGAFRSELLAKVKALAAREVRPAALPAAPPPAPRASVGRRPPVAVLLIGCSTGGPNALATVFQSLPGDLPVPILIVQHMPPLFTRLLAERLTASSRVHTVEGQEGMPIEPGRAYIAPGNFHMSVAKSGARFRLALDQNPPENSCRPAVDVLFRSAAAAFGPGVLAAVLTGMGHDGTRGARDVVDAGGAVIVQDAASCVVPSMPSSVAAAGAADAVLPLELIGHELTTRVRRGASVRAQAPAGRVEV